MKDKSLQDARQAWILAEIKKLKLESPVAELSRKLQVGMSLVSEVMSQKASVSVKFFRSFCEAYGFNHDEVNHTLIENIKKQITDGHVPGAQTADSHSASCRHSKGHNYPCGAAHLCHIAFRERFYTGVYC